MNISRFFIDRPIFAGVLSATIFLAGLIAIFNLPVSEYPDVAPPSVVVRAQYPGAHPQTIAETVATPIEEQVNGVEGMLYMNSQATPDGQLTLTVTFRLGTNPDLAQQMVQNRVNQALPRLPEPVQRLGVTTIKSSPDLTMVVHLRSPNERYDMQYLRNYAVLNIKDQLARINGMGQVQVAGSGDYAMRIWLDPRKLAARNLSPGDVVQALREQNVDAAAGVIGASPSVPGVDYQISVNAKGRLKTEEEFRDVIVRTSADGLVTRLRDVARVELAAGEYALRTLVNNKQATAILIYQLPGSNALQISKDVRQRMAELKQAMPEGVDYQVVYDPTEFVRSSIDAVIHTLFEAVLLVVVVVIVFLQTWRASIIPLLAVPVSVVGTFAVMLAMGFSINALSLFGLVLAIGVVVDDAIVVVENVERNIGLGLSAREATYQAMREVSGPIVAIALTLCAVFVPLAFVSGLSGQFFKQFALTIAISTVISAFNSLTLSPALAALLLKGHDAPKDAFQRAFDKLFGGFFVRFNRLFGRASDRYGVGVSRILKRKTAALLVYGLLAMAAVLLFNRVPAGFVPPQDKQYLVGFVQLPDASSLDRTEAVLREMTATALAQPGVEAVTGYAGWSINGFVSSPNSGVAFFVLKDFAERKGADMTGNAIAAQLNAKFADIKGAYTAVFPPPPVSGLGSVGGFKLQLQDRAALGNAALNDALQAFMAEARKAPELAGMFSSFQMNVPQLYADVDRTRAQQLGLSIPSVFEALQVYLGSLYVNDFNAFGRTFQVKVQADAQFRAHAEDIALLKTSNDKGQMVPLASVLKIEQRYGPDQAMRYNGFPSADVSGAPAAGYSSGQALQAVERIAAQTLPRGIGYEWTEITYQDKIAGNTLVIILPLAMLLVFFVLAAQYESLTLPIAVLLIVPMGILSAIAGVWMTGGDNNLFTQISFVVLVGLACKNAILIVEFAHELEHQGRSIRQAAIEAARLRLRPILMTSIAFIAGVVPLILATGAGAEMRHAMGIAVFTGMIGVTLFGLFLTPLFYVLLRQFSVRFTRGAGAPAAQRDARAASVEG
ncbi:efflux RND transporter permease subunit [Pseudomonas asiatica]|uniref:efflux RND transporter permease subunit n=1 Tax=Pseudomonas asiatica TaxID=2219225 RepID=UPI0025A3E7BF|nr:multidrug efflux RND transporter permease subunit [Pseudomonas asiatica]WJN49414.1 multidrug efflux RND transporter permease subunit [Pseudomonas asiatica]